MTSTTKGTKMGSKRDLIREFLKDKSVDLTFNQAKTLWIQSGSKETFVSTPEYYLLRNEKGKTTRKKRTGSRTEIIKQFLADKPVMGYKEAQELWEKEGNGKIFISNPAFYRIRMEIGKGEKRARYAADSAVDNSQREQNIENKLAKYLSIEDKLIQVLSSCPDSQLQNTIRQSLRRVGFILTKLEEAAK